MRNKPITPRMRVAFVPMKNSFIGIARSIIYNELYRNSSKGVLVLRIDDTDSTKSDADYHSILNDLRLLGLSWDEGPDVGGPYSPYIQSQRGDIYINHVNQLLDRGLAYRCFCKGENSNCQCFELPKEEVYKRSISQSYCVRFHLCKKEDYIDDLIHGRIKMDTSILKNPVILRSDHTPTFHIATVVDDTLFHITHILRGSDHIIGAFIQKQLFEAFNYPVPQFAHFSIFTNMDKTAIKVGDYDLSLENLLKTGYPKEAIVSFLAQNGYHGNVTVSDHHIMTKDFSFSRFSKNNTAYDVTHLYSISKRVIKDMSNEHFLEWALDGADDILRNAHPQLILSQQKRIKNKKELIANIHALYDCSEEYVSKTERLIYDSITRENAMAILSPFVVRLRALQSWDLSNIEQVFSSLTTERLKSYQLIRTILTGNCPFGDLHELISLFGKENTINKLGLFLQ